MFIIVEKTYTILKPLKAQLEDFEEDSDDSITDKNFEPNVEEADQSSDIDSYTDVNYSRWPEEGVKFLY